MPHRLLKMNNRLKRVVGEVLLRDLDIPPGILITVSRVDTTHNLRSATVWLYISPSEKTEAIMTLIQTSMYDIQGSVNTEMNMRAVPRLFMRADTGIHNTDSVEKLFHDLKKEGE